MEDFFPEYLKQNIHPVKLAEFKSKGQVVCSCGCEEFDYNYLFFKYVCSEEFHKMMEIDKWSLKMKEERSGPYAQFKKDDKIPLVCWNIGAKIDGKTYNISHFDVYNWKKGRNTLEAIMKSPYYIGHVEQEPFDPNKPTEYQYIYAKCKHCGKEILLFDDRYYGYDGVCTHFENPNKPYLDNGKVKTKKPHCEGAGYKIYVTIDSTGKDDLFEEDTDGMITEENWKNAFEWIKIDLECTKCGKKKNVLNLETM